MLSQLFVATENIKANVRGGKQDGGGRGDGNEIKTDSVSDGGKQEIWKLRDEIKMCAWCRKQNRSCRTVAAFHAGEGKPLLWQHAPSLR